MRTGNRIFRSAALILMICYAQAFFLPNFIWAQAPPCPYDQKAPSVENARRNFKGLNFKCAEQELTDFLKKDKLSLEEKSDAHILLATVYYAMLKDDTEKRGRVMEQFKEAFKVYREWRGELDIKSPEFADLMEQAKTQVDKETAEKQAAQKQAQDSTKQAAVPKTKTGGKPWYTKWWAIGLGVGVVAGVAVALAGGGGGGTTQQVIDTLPTFPPPPTK